MKTYVRFMIESKLSDPNLTDKEIIQILIKILKAKTNSINIHRK